MTAAAAARTIGVVDTTTRDGNQSLWSATGLTTRDVLAIAPTVVHAAALWGLGVTGGYLVAFGGFWGPPWGIAGMWLMQSVALALAAVLLVGVYYTVGRLRVAKGLGG